jgi:sec-independent protein translocase protein TatB
MGLENLGGWELIVIILVGLFIFGPDRLPKAISDGLRMLRTLRQMARNATTDLSRELGTQVELEDLNPKTFLRKHLLSEEDEQALRKPLQDVYSEVRGVADSVKLDTTPASPAVTPPAQRPAISQHSYDDAT